MRVTKKPSGRVIFFLVVSRVIFFFAVNARNKKTVRSCNFFFAVSRVSRLTRLTAEKKNYTTIRFFCYAHLQRKKKITRITTYTA